MGVSVDGSRIFPGGFIEPGIYFFCDDIGGVFSGFGVSVGRSFIFGPEWTDRSCGGGGGCLRSYGSGGGSVFYRGIIFARDGGCGGVSVGSVVPCIGWDIVNNRCPEFEKALISPVPLLSTPLAGGPYFKIKGFTIENNKDII